MNTDFTTFLNAHLQGIRSPSLRVFNTEKPTEPLHKVKNEPYKPADIHKNEHAMLNYQKRVDIANEENTAYQRSNGYLAKTAEYNKKNKQYKVAEEKYKNTAKKIQDDSNTCENNITNFQSNFWENFEEYFNREDETGKKDALCYMAKHLEPIPRLIEVQTVWVSDNSGEEYNDFSGKSCETTVFPGNKNFNQDVIHPINKARLAVRNALFGDEKSAIFVARMFSETTNLDQEAAVFYQKMRLENDRFNSVLQSGAAYTKKTGRKNYLDILLNSHKPSTEHRLLTFYNTHFNSTNAATQAQWKRRYIAKFEAAYAENGMTALKNQILACIANRFNSHHLITAGPTEAERALLTTLQAEICKPQPDLTYIRKTLDQGRAPNVRKLTKTECLLDAIHDYLNRINSPNYKKL